MIISIKVHFITQGCRANQAETASLINQFKSFDFEYTDQLKQANIVVINTCTVTQNGDNDTRRLIQKIIRENPLAKIVLIGCQAQVKAEELAGEHIFLIVGTAQKMNLAQLLTQELAKAPNAHSTIINSSITNSYFSQEFPSIDPSRTRANLKIQDGCNAFCTYCIVPYARGPARSRVWENILAEAGLLVGAGYQELILTGINVGQYNYEGKTIADLLQALLKLPGIQRLRLSSIEPKTVSAELIDLLADPLMCTFLHIPLQAGADAVLTRMNRHYTVADYRELIERLYCTVPGICLGTDVMVGFPGETEQDFNQTYQLLAALPLAYFHVFPFSERKQTKSSSLPDKVPANIKEERSKILRDLSLVKRQTFLKSLLGTSRWVLFEEEKQGCWVGFTDNYMHVKVKTQQNLKNQLREINLVDTLEDYFIGEIV